MIRSSLVLVTIISLATACSKKSSDGAAAGKTGDPAPAAAGPTKLAKLGLQIEVPGEVNVGDGIGADSVMLQGASIGALQVEVAATPKSLDDAKNDAKDYSPKNLKADTLPDGWALTYENTGGAGANYFVSVRRDIGGKTYNCSTTGSDPGQAQAVLAACKSLRK